ncbi:MAG TPA: arginine--tRNA ligase [Acidimicrobiia bacterium]
MSLLAELSELVGKVFANLGLDPSLGQVQVSSRPELAEFQCNGALVAAKSAGRSARELAQEVVDRLDSASSIVQKAEVAGPGFINLTITDEALTRFVNSTSDDPQLGVPKADPARVVLVDYAGPNVAKAMHVGHIRATIIGDSLARLFRFLGHQVIRDPHFGDWGLQMGQVIAAIEERWPDLPYFTSDGPYPDESPVTLADLQELYPISAARTEADEAWADRARKITVDLQQGHPGYRALWRHMKTVSEKSQRQDFANLGVEFDLWYGESDVADQLGALVEGLRAKGLVKESDGALVLSVTEEGDNRELPPLILETSKGAYLYGTTDLATLEHRVRDLGVEVALYVVDARQSDHFQVLFRAARKAGIISEQVVVEHIRFGTMNGPDGKPFKTRAGGIVALADLIEMITEKARERLEEADIAQAYPDSEREKIARQVGVAALKFGDLINNRVSDYLFDLDRFSSFEGKTGPYLQYGVVRIQSIERRAAELGLEAGPIEPPTVEAERNLMLALLRLPEVAERAAELRAPNHLAEYAFDLTATWNRFYETCRIIDERNPRRRASWITLAGVTRRVLVKVLDLLGIEVPERM